MELFFLALLFFFMMWALTTGFPVAFALPGSAILAVGLAAASGYIFEGDPSAYFAQDGPSQWLSAGVTNFRSLYWIVERDTLIAIPLFIFMGIMLQRSKIAEDLLVAMAQLFGPLPGGLGISVVFVGALLAATTGIVGATVIAMGLISLPAMLRNNYSKSLATGTICASGTLGQIIPPSIVLIILADQLSNAADQANTMRKALYREATGEFSMPSHFDVVSASAGDMFMGALVPGMILVGLYMLYILIVAWINPKMAPPVPYNGKYDRHFALNIFLALVPPLTLIFVVLGSIILGVATVNQAGAIGAIGAMIMASYRLHTGSKRTKYLPTLIVLTTIVLIGYLSSQYDLNVKNISSDSQWLGIKMAIFVVAILVLAVAWSTWRIIKIDNTLKDVMIDTAKMTSMVFIILIGAAMLTAAFRGFGGEELVKHFLTTLPGGFWAQFVVVMLVIFLLGFFLDFIEIAVVVVPIVAPILLSNPEANVTAVWLGVMIGLNIQTSFLTPPFGFALFYLRGVADKVVKTVDIYKGASAFILLQIVGLIIVGLNPTLVNYLPNRTHLLSETAPPPMNPKLQICLEDYVLDQYDNNGDTIKASLNTAQQFDISYLPKKLQNKFNEGLNDARQSQQIVQQIKQKKEELDAYIVDYQPLQQAVNFTKTDIRNANKKLEILKKRLERMDENNTSAIDSLKSDIKAVNDDIASLTSNIPKEWDARYKGYKALSASLTKLRRQYNSAVDSSYETLTELKAIISSATQLETFTRRIQELKTSIVNDPAKQAIKTIKKVESDLGDIKGSYVIKAKLAKARRILKKDKSDEASSKSIAFIEKGQKELSTELMWRKKAAHTLLAQLDTYDNSIKKTIGLRSQPRLTDTQAKNIAHCLSYHRNISLEF